MPPPPAQRNSLCLFCAFSARTRLQPQRRLPRLQAAHRSDTRSDTRWTPRGSGKKPSSFFNPLKKSNPFRSHDPKLQSDAFDAVRWRLAKLKEELANPEFRERLQISQDEFEEEWLAFERSINGWIKQPTPELARLAAEDARGKRTLATRLRYLFYAQACGGRFTKAELENQKEVADLRYPAEWYPATREIPRTVHLHVGPTNSGKTYHALKRLEEAQSGIYLGPLRLLAHEVYTRLNAKGKACALVTGEEQRMPDGKTPAMFSCTVEMAPLNTPFEVAVIDEIQMISHEERGWAWTQAFFGLQAKEIHLCGEARTVPLMRELCALVGDEVHVHEYERLTPLKVEPRSLGGQLRKLEKGDCIVAFSVLGIHALRIEVEKKTGKKCAIVYGGLPPETRAQQARLFNDPDNEYDYLVASDAIGMGLNLAIKRVILESVYKSNGVNYYPLQISEVKQIAGRAGRFRTAHQAVTTDSTKTSAADTPADPAIGLDDMNTNSVATKESKDQTIGWVTTLDPVDHAYLKKAMSREPEPIKTAGLFPPSIVVERFSNYFPPGTPFSYILLRLHEISEIHPRFHLCALKDQLAIADAIHMIKDLTIQDRIVICAAPISMRDNGEKKFLQALAQCIADGKSGNLLEIEALPLSVMDQPATKERKYLYGLEQLHKMIVCYLWLSYRFPNVFTTRPLANYTKKLVEDQIEKVLTEFSFVEQARAIMLARRNKARKSLNALDKGMIAEQMGGRQVPAPPGMPEEAKDIVNGKTALADDPAPMDDAAEYPEDLPVTSKFDTLAEEQEQRTARLSEEVGDLLQSRNSTLSNLAGTTENSI